MSTLQSFDLFGVVLRERFSSLRDGREFDAQYRGVHATVFVSQADLRRLGEREALKAPVFKFKKEIDG